MTTEPNADDSQNQLWYKIVLRSQIVFNQSPSSAPQNFDSENTLAEKLLQILNQV